MRTSSLALALTLSVAIAGCGVADEGTGSVSFSTWGEAYIEQEIPAVDVADGWTIRYQKFLVNIGSISIADDRGEIFETFTSKIFDHTKPGAKPVVTFRNLPAHAFPHVSYEIGAATSSSEVVDVDESDKALMVTNGYSIYVEANATKGKGSASKNYQWGFRTATLYDRCKGELGGKDTDGVVVTNGGTDQVELTIHGDHLYYDDLQAKEAKVRFDNIAAADADRDDVITMDELTKVKLAAIPAESGPYGTGSAAAIYDLGAFVTALSRTIGHFRGEGECFASGNESGRSRADARPIFSARRGVAATHTVH